MYFPPLLNDDENSLKGKIQHHLFFIIFRGISHMNIDDFIGNLSTIVKILICILAPSAAIWLGTDENTAIALLTAIAGLLFSLVDAKYPNTFAVFDNKTIIANAEYILPDEEEDDDE